MEQTTLLVAGREYKGALRSLDDQAASLSDKYGASIRLLHCDEVDISSGELREMESRGKRLYKYVPKPVEEYIMTRGLYQE